MEYLAGGVVFQLYPLTRKKGAATLICYKVGSERRRDTFQGDEEAAKKHCKNNLAKTVTTGDASIHLSPLDKRVWIETKAIAAKIGRAPDILLRELLEAQQLLGPGVTVLEASRDYKRRHSTGLLRASVSQVVEELLTFLEGKRRDKSTVKSLRIPLRRLAGALRMPINEVQTVDLERWLGGYPGNAPRTTNNWISAIVRLFNYAKGRYLPREATTVADALERVTDNLKDRPVEIYQPWELAALLHQAPQRLKFLIAIGAFAGLRTIELHRLDWSHVNLRPLPDPAAPKVPEPKDKKPDPYPHGFIEVPGNIGKQHRAAARRIVPIQPNLEEWLEESRLLSGRVSPYANDRSISAAISALTKQINVEREKHRLPLISRPDNGCRHSYGSYRLPALGNKDLLALEMNNSPEEIDKHYRELVRPRFVEEYWSIVPVPLTEQREFSIG